MQRRIFLSATLAGIAGGALAAERDVFDRLGTGQPLRFRNAQGGSFIPSDLVLVTDTGVFGASLPETADIQDEDRVDLSGVPLVGGIFKGTTAPSDARQGMLVGAVQRSGDTLVVRASGFPDGLQRAPVVVSTSVPRLGPVSYDLGRLTYGDVVIPTVQGAVIGSAHLVDNRLVIASKGGEPAYPSVEALVEDLFN